MADICLHAHRVRVVSVRPHLDNELGPFAVVRLTEGEDFTSVHVTKDGVWKAREIAAALNAASNAVEDAHHGIVPIESLAPDPRPAA